MMLVHLPAMDNVPGLPFVDRLPSFNLPGRLSSFSHRLYSPNLWLTLLATLVILSSFRAAILFFRPKRSIVPMAKVSLIPGVGIVRVEKGALSGSSSPSTSANGGVSAMQEKQDEKKMSSLLWGLVKWDALPPFPIARRDVGAVSVSETERGRSPSQRQQQQGLRIQLPQGRHTGPAFDRPVPAIYQTDVPVSMAKMIMSRHTFRRPSSRPPPVRNANAAQYSKKLPSMV